MKNHHTHMEFWFELVDLIHYTFLEYACVFLMLEASFQILCHLVPKLPLECLLLGPISPKVP